MVHALLGPLLGVDIDLKQLCGPFAVEFDRIRGGRHKDAFTGVDWTNRVKGLDRSDAVSAKVYDERVELHKVLAHRLVECDEIGCEIRAFGQTHGVVWIVFVVGLAVLCGVEIDGI